MHLMALGMFLFAISTLGFEELQRKTDWRHARAPRIGARDATQFVGLGDETVSLSGSVFTELVDGRVSLDELRAMADTGEVFPLLDGTGLVWGAYVITAIDERHAALMADGTPRRIDFGIDLLRVDDPANLYADVESSADNTFVLEASGDDGFETEFGIEFPV